jgi:NitT/TauT family transport system substrate-binding protein
MCTPYPPAHDQGERGADHHPAGATRPVSPNPKMLEDVIPGLVLPTWPAEINRESVEAISPLAQDQRNMLSRLDIDTLLP